MNRCLLFSFAPRSVFRKNRGHSLHAVSFTTYRAPYRQNFYSFHPNVHTLVHIRMKEHCIKNIYAKWWRRECGDLAILMPRNRTQPGGFVRISGVGVNVKTNVSFTWSFFGKALTGYRPARPPSSTAECLAAVLLLEGKTLVIRTRVRRRNHWATRSTKKSLGRGTDAHATREDGKRRAVHRPDERANFRGTKVN